jgi:N-acetylglucosamine malate deacetylase 1
VTRYFEKRMESLLAYRSQYGEIAEGGTLFPDEQEIRERLSAVARFYGNLIGVKYGEPYVVKEIMRIDDVISLPVRSL